ncbi:MAG TPA: cytochrome b/b6 domain-containing protein [Desulfobacteria bacterium]|nr:cytochrome b/b6 domain-containing protein [Desulfobacteria bacterium]
MRNRMIKRHDQASILIHWFNAACWFFLLATGLGLISNPTLQPIVQWWPRFMRDLFGGGAALLKVHIIVGVVWAGIWLIFIIAGIVRYTLPFLKQIVTYKLPRDIQWMIKKNLQMTMGYKNMARMVKPLGWNGKIPDQGFYNAGQKAAAAGMIAGAVVLVITGVIMAISKVYLNPAQTPLVQWSITIHYMAAAVTFGILLIHIYMAAISREERPAFISMFTGEVPEEYARHHHKLWYEKVDG